MLKLKKKKSLGKAGKGWEGWPPAGLWKGMVVWLGKVRLVVFAI